MSIKKKLIIPFLVIGISIPNLLINYNIFKITSSHLSINNHTTNNSIGDNALTSQFSVYNNTNDDNILLDEEKVVLKTENLRPITYTEYDEILSKYKLKPEDFYYFEKSFSFINVSLFFNDKNDAIYIALNDKNKNLIYNIVYLNAKDKYFKENKTEKERLFHLNKNTVIYQINQINTTIDVYDSIFNNHYLMGFYHLINYLPVALLFFIFINIYLIIYTFKKHKKQEQLSVMQTIQLENIEKEFIKKKEKKELL